MRGDEIKSGDHVQFAYLPSAMRVTPILVTDVAPNGMIQLGGRGWYQPHLLMKVYVPKTCFGQRKKAS